MLVNVIILWPYQYAVVVLVNSIEICDCRAWCPTPVDPAHGRLLEENCEFEDSLAKT